MVLFQKCVWRFNSSINFFFYLLFWSKSDYPSWSSCPFFIKFIKMTKATFFFFFLPKLSSFIDWCCYYTQVSYTGSWEPLVDEILSTWWKYINRGGSLRSIYFHVSIKKTIYRYKKAKILLLSCYMYLKAVISHPWHHSYCSKKEWMNECCLTPTQQFFSYIMARKC